MQVLRVILFLSLCLMISGILAFIPILSIEKLRSGYVKIDLLPGKKEVEVTPSQVTKKKGRTTLELWPRKVSIVRKLHEDYVPLQEISFETVHAIMVSEDMKFYIHNGVDFEQLEHAFNEYRRGRPLRGASTITQQLVKNIFLTNERSVWRKIREFILAIYLDARLPKTKIVELYLNAIEFGPNIYGIKKASQYYFGKLPKNLTAKEGAFLGMLLPSPVRYSSSFRHRYLSPYARSTVNQILFKMKNTGFLSGQKYFEALSAPLSFEKAPVSAPLSASETFPQI
ncbi:MAG: transglycosylase domain-containing protein [Bdellovibrio sp.]|nr:transglycosylase domain-containing protein [Bdellovibrio sp.]